MQPLDIGPLLAHLPLFRSLDAERLALMAQSCHQLRVPRHGFVFHRGDPAHGLYVVAVGLVKLALPSARGHEKAIEFFGPGQAFGEAVMFLGRPHAVDAQALEDSLLICVDKKDIDAAIDSDAAFARRMLAGLSLRLQTLVHDIETVTLQNAMQRIVTYLLEQPRNGSLTSFPVNKNIIASKLGLTPETLSRLLHQLSSTGLIAVDGKEVMLLDLPALEEKLLVN